MVVSWRLLLSLLLLFPHHFAKYVTVDGILGYTPDYQCGDRTVGLVQEPEELRATRGPEPDVWHINSQGEGRLNLVRSAGEFAVENANRVFGVLIPINMSLNVSELTINNLLTRRDFIAFEMIPSPYPNFNWETVFWSIADSSKYTSYITVEMTSTNIEPVISNFTYYNDSQIRGKNTTNANCNPQMTERFIIPENYSVPIPFPPGTDEYCSFLQGNDSQISEFVPDSKLDIVTVPLGTCYLNLTRSEWLLKHIKTFIIPAGSVVYVIDSAGVLLVESLLILGSLFMGAGPCRLRGIIQIIGLGNMEVNSGVVSIFGKQQSRTWARPMYGLSPGDKILYFDPGTYVDSDWGINSEVYIGVTYLETLPSKTTSPEYRRVGRKYHNNAIALNYAVSNYHYSSDEHSYFVASLDKSIIASRSWSNVMVTEDVALKALNGSYVQGADNVKNHGLLFSDVIGIRFPTIPIPKDAIILEAKISFVAANSAPIFEGVVGFAIVDTPKSKEWSEKTLNGINILPLGFALRVSNWKKGSHYLTQNFGSLIAPLISDERYDPTDNSLAFILQRRSGVFSVVHWIPEWSPSIIISYSVPSNGSIIGRNGSDITFGGVYFNGLEGSVKDKPFQQYTDSTNITISDCVFHYTHGGVHKAGTGRLTVVHSSLLNIPEVSGFVAEGDVQTQFLYCAIDSHSYRVGVRSYSFETTFNKGDVSIIGNAVSISKFAYSVTNPSKGNKLIYYGNEIYLGTILTGIETWSSPWYDGGIGVFNNSIWFRVIIYVESDVLLLNLYLGKHSNINYQATRASTVIIDSGYVEERVDTTGWQFSLAQPGGTTVFRNFKHGGRNSTRSLVNTKDSTPGLSIIINDYEENTYVTNSFNTTDYYYLINTNMIPSIVVASQWWNPCEICRTTNGNMFCEQESYEDFPYDLAQVVLYSTKLVQGQGSFFMKRVGGLSGPRNSPVLDSSPAYTEFLTTNYTLVGPTRGALLLNYSTTGVPQVFTIAPKTLYAPIFVSILYPTANVGGEIIDVTLDISRNVRKVNSIDELISVDEVSYFFDGNALTIKITLPKTHIEYITPEGVKPLPYLQMTYSDEITITADCGTANIKDFCFGFMSRIPPSVLFNCSGDPVEMWDLTEEADLLQDFEYVPNTNCLLSTETELPCSVYRPYSNCSGEMTVKECAEMCKNTISCRTFIYNPYEHACRLTVGCSKSQQQTSRMTPWYSFVKLETLFCPMTTPIMQHSAVLNISAPDIRNSNAVITQTGWVSGSPGMPAFDPERSFIVDVTPSGVVVDGSANSWLLSFKTSVPKKLILSVDMHTSPILVSIPYPTSTSSHLIYVAHNVTATDFADGLQRAGHEAHTSHTGHAYDTLEAMYDCEELTCYFYDGNVLTVKITPRFPIRKRQQVSVQIEAACEGDVCEGILSRVVPSVMFNCTSQQIVSWDLVQQEQANYTSYDYYPNSDCQPTAEHNFDLSCSVYSSSSLCSSRLSILECKELCDLSKECAGFIFNPFESACRLSSGCENRVNSLYSPWHMFVKNKNTVQSAAFPIAMAAGIVIGGLVFIFLVIIIIVCQREKDIKIVQELSIPMVDYELEEIEWVRSDSWKAIRVIGNGAFGVVYEARNESGMPLAVKVVTCHGDEDSKSIEVEFEIVKNLSHPNIVKYFDCEVIAGKRVCLLMEYLAEGSLTKLIDSMGTVPLQACRRYGRDIMKGLEYLHANKIIHRDVKGDNVLLTSGNCKLSDFGCSTKATETLGASTVVGTPRWMAPEVIKSGVSGYGPKADVWSAGCTICQMLTGEPPWPKLSTAWEMMYHITSTDPSLPEFEDASTNRILSKMVCPSENRLTVSELLGDVWFDECDDEEIMYAS